MPEKTSRVFMSRINKTCFDPSTTARARKDLRSTERPYRPVTPEPAPDNRGLTAEEQSE